MNRKILFAVLAIGLLPLLGCNNGEVPIDTAKLESPVNQATVSVVRQDSREVAADALGRIGTPAVPALAEALSDPVPSVRVDACRALAYMGAKAKDAVPPLTRTLSDPEEAVRQEAARALGQIGDSAQLAIPDLIQMLHGKR
jgi:HEAT repeat protein